MRHFLKAKDYGAPLFHVTVMVYIPHSLRAEAERFMIHETRKPQHHLRPNNPNPAESEVRGYLVVM